MNSQKTTILFVDDEDNILRGLKRMMRPKREDWDTVFASSGLEALACLEKQHIDVVVSDMRMPGMDGAALLTQVQTLYPQIVRIVLSGYAEKEAILKTIGPSHQYLAKPCDPDKLIETIQRSIRLRVLLRSGPLRKIVSGMQRIPTLPKIFATVVKELDYEYASAESLADKISQDIGVSTHLLKLTNSAYFGLPMPATSPKQAITFLGFENVKAIVLLGGIFDQIRGNQSVSDIVEKLSRRSMQLGLLARAIAEENGLSQEEQDQSYCTGLVSHVGTLLLVANWPDEYGGMVRLIEQERLPVVEAEMEIFGATHSELGAYLLGLWGFNDSIVEAVAFHHNPDSCSGDVSGILLATHVAQHLLRVKRNPSVREDRFAQSIDQDFLNKLGGEDDMKRWEATYNLVSEEWPYDTEDSFY